jgi:hypothetical protein
MTDRQLLVDLTDADENVRAEAREELNMMMDDEIARAFLDVIASDTGEEIVADTIIGLGPIIEEAGLDFEEVDDESGEDLDEDLDDELGPGISPEMFRTILREIRGIYDDAKQPKLVRRRAFEVLVRNPRAWQAQEIRNHVASEDRDWTMTAVFAMGHVPGFDREIARFVESAEGDLLFEAVRAAAQMEVTEVARRVRELAQSSEDRDIRLAAIDALPHVDPKCRDLLEKLARSKDGEIAETASAALDELSIWSRDDGE